MNNYFMKKLLLLLLFIPLISFGQEFVSKKSNIISITGVASENPIKEQKAVNADQLEELKRTNEIICKLQEENNKLKRSSVDTQLNNIAVGALGLFAGFSFKS